MCQNDSNNSSSYSAVGRSEHGPITEVEESATSAHALCDSGKSLPDSMSPDESLSVIAAESNHRPDLAPEGATTQAPAAASAPGPFFTIKYILLQCWGRYPYVYTAALATGLRLGAGYVWAAYNGVFFAPLFHNQLGTSSSHCQYSYDSSSITDVAVSSTCNVDYPYCVEGRCSALVQNPWHGQGMPAGRLEAFMLWVPLLGSALGNIVGGALSDRIIARTAILAIGDMQLKPDLVEGTGRLHVLANNTSSCQGTGDVELSVAMGFTGDTSEDGTYASNETEPVGTGRLSTADGARDGVQTAAATHFPASALRLLVCAGGNFCAMPFVTLALIAPYPACFLVQVPAGFLGECYLGQTLAVVSDARLTGVPAELTSAAVALFMLMVICIGGNLTLLVPFFMSALDYDRPVEIRFEAAPVYNTSTSVVMQYSVCVADPRKLQMAILSVFLLGYLGSAVLYLLAHLQMKHKHHLWWLVELSTNI